MRAAGPTLLAALTVAAAVPAQEPSQKDLLAAVEKRMRTVAETAGPCVGCVVVSRSDRYPKPAGDAVPGQLGGFASKEFLKANTTPGDVRTAASLDLSDPKNIPDHGYACGVVIDPSGLVLTPYHVVEGATKVYVHLPDRPGSYADIHAADSRSDLAVLKLLTPPPQLPAIKFADVRLGPPDDPKTTVSSGKLVVMVANVYVTGFALGRPSVALGGITRVTHPGGAPKNESPTSYYQYAPLLKHDARLSAVSGAALVNLDGELVGLTTTGPLVTDGEGGYAIPADEYFHRAVGVLRRGEEIEYGYLGVQGPAPHPNGVGFASVLSLGPAAQAGMDEQDVLVKVNGATTRNYEELFHHIGSSLAGTKVKLTLRRFNRDREVDVMLGKFKNDQPFIASVRPDPVFGLRVEYGSILAQPGRPDNVRRANGVPPGVCVRELNPNSPAATAFKTLGDDPKRWLITHVNGTAVGNPAEFYKAAKGQQSVKLTVRDPIELNPRDREVSFP